MLTASLLLVGCSYDSDYWEAVKQRDTVAAYQSFQRSYPRSEHGPQAQRRIEELELKAAKAESGTAGLESFGRKYPDSPLAQEAAGELRSRRLAAAREQATVKAADEFLRMYPQGDDSDALRAELPELIKWEASKPLAAAIISLSPSQRAAFGRNNQLDIRTVPGAPVATVLAEVKGLLQRGADPNCVKIKGFSKGFSHTSTEAGHTSTVTVYGSPGEPVRATQEGLTLLEYCQQNEYRDVAELLKAHGAR
jgi:hypothetical protein